MEVVLSCNAISLVFPSFLAAQPALARNTRSVQLKFEISFPTFMQLFIYLLARMMTTKTVHVILLNTVFPNTLLQLFVSLDVVLIKFAISICMINFHGDENDKAISSVQALLLDLALFFHTPYNKNALYLCLEMQIRDENMCDIPMENDTQ